MRTSSLSKIICGVIFYEGSEQNSMLRLRRATVDSPPAVAIRSNFRLPTASMAPDSSSGTPLDDREQGNRYADNNHQFESQNS
jgi:hypothetical protein